MFLIACVLLSTLTTAVNAVHNIDDYGARSTPDNSPVGWLNWKLAEKNSQALEKAIQAANSEEDLNERVVILSQGNNYYMSAVEVSELHNVEVRVEGNITYSDIISAWPKKSGGKALPLFAISNSSEVSITGNGYIDGQGLKWWRYTFTGTEIRPFMFLIEQCQGIDDLYIQ